MLKGLNINRLWQNVHNQKGFILYVKCVDLRKPYHYHIGLCFTRNYCIFRKRHEKISNEKVESLQEKLSVATATLQQALGGVSMQINAVAEKVSNLTQGNLHLNHIIIY